MIELLKNIYVFLKDEPRSLNEINTFINSSIEPINQAISILKENELINEFLIQGNSVLFIKSEMDLDKIKQIEQNLQIIQLKTELKALKLKIGSNYNSINKDYNDYINQLHLYNELKDTVQSLLGKMASIEMVTTKEMYLKYGLDFED